MAQKSFKLPDPLAERLAARAKELERSESWVIVRALEEALGQPTAPRPTGVPSPPSPAPPRASDIEKALGDFDGAERIVERFRPNVGPKRFTGPIPKKGA